MESVIDVLKRRNWPRPADPEARQRLLDAVVRARLAADSTDAR